MREFQAKKKIRKFIYSKTMLVIMVIIFLVLIRSTVSVYHKQKLSAANVFEANQQLTKLQQRQELLNSEIARLSTDQGIESEIRSKYSVEKPGEHMLIMVNATTTASSTPVQTKESWWDKFKNLFK